MKGEWKPIETAPRDGTSIIVYRPKFSATIPEVGEDYWYRSAGAVMCWGRSNRYYQPTHWQPMPEPPA